MVKETVVARCRVDCVVKEVEIQTISRAKIVEQNKETVRDKERKRAKEVADKIKKERKCER